MKIKSLTFKDKDRNILIDNVEFADLTLFVGASGVGKSQILDAISTLQKICLNTYSECVEWDVVLTDEDREIQWQGCTERITHKHKIKLLFDGGGQKAEKVKEVLYTNEVIFIDGKEIARRSPNTTLFEGASLPKLSNKSSLVYLLEEKGMQDIKNFFINIIGNDSSLFSFDNDELDSYPIHSCEELCNLNARLFVKLQIASHTFHDIFESIKNDFMSIFPFVNNVFIGTIKNQSVVLCNTVIMNEENVDVDISFFDLSSGMQKALTLLTAIHLAPKGSVLIVDELENCLGINCLDSIVEILQDNDRDIQAIFTSHHPYIINAIPREHWRLVSREGGVIHSDAVADKMSKISKHDAFLQLLQMPAFRDGVRS